MIKRPGTFGFGKMHGSSICCDIHSLLARESTICPRTAEELEVFGSAENESKGKQTQPAMTPAKILMCFRILMDSYSRVAIAWLVVLLPGHGNRNRILAHIHQQIFAPQKHCTTLGGCRVANARAPTLLRSRSFCAILNCVQRGVFFAGVSALSCGGLM